ncbi:MAG: hypothetical protein ACTSQV_04575, partial [Alphaproteobacteria bacterium]
MPDGAGISHVARKTTPPIRIRITAEMIKMGNLLMNVPGNAEIFCPATGIPQTRRANYYRQPTEFVI